MTDPDTDAESTDDSTDTDHEADTDSAESDEVPPTVVDEAERLTRLARDAVDENEAVAYRERRDELVADHDFRARVREDGERDTLVLYPDEWIEDGLVHPDRIDDVDRGIERPLEGGGASENWDAVESHNRAIVEQVAAEHGEPHAANVAAFADFMGNHYARPLDDATEAEREEFLSEYFPRNAWPTDAQRDAVEESLALALEVAETIEPAR